MEKENSLLTKQDLLSETTFLVPQIEQITMVDFDEFVGKNQSTLCSTINTKNISPNNCPEKSRRILAHGWLKGSNRWK